jgi:hypothetical protein
MSGDRPRAARALRRPDGAFSIVLADGWHIPAASIVEAHRILRDLQAGAPVPLSGSSWPTSGRGQAQALDCPEMPHPDPSRLVGAESVALF